LIGTLIALALLTTFFIIYTWYRRKAEKRLCAAHAQLQQAYDQLEETTTAKERIESELRIARDIQMSMVPGVFPQHEGLDMYAEMNPAKEVGGDLYGYVMQGDVLYFCLGDVSGKGVPASLFMAQSARLFRTLAAEGMMPADIAVRMNNALAENNDRGMFVTMFIGLLHLDTGRLDYCNCGHNAPIIDGQFLKMQYDNQPLGLWEEDPFEGETIDDIRGRQLLIYTDGLNEAENQQKQLLGNKRLQELMADSQNLDSHQVIDMLKEAVEQHRNGAEPNDDLTLMCIRLGAVDRPEPK
jgi:serine phosphatase RsbU (regulator of sigma subunit)